MHGQIDLGVDLGESADRWQSGLDRELLSLASSANVCCGAYAGDDDLIKATCAAAVEHGVAIGAQVGYVDRAGFGRRFIDVPPRDLEDQLRHQIDHLSTLADQVGAIVTFVKPHGALYHQISHDEAQASAVVEALLADTNPLPLVGMAGSLALQFAQDEGIDVVLEGFADRTYLPDGRLAARDQPDAFISDPAQAAAQAVTLAESVASICVHSDSPNAVEVLTAVRAELERHEFAVGPVLW